MEGGTTEQDYFEFEMLLGEIPNVTSAAEVELDGGLSISDSPFNHNPEGKGKIDESSCSPRNNVKQEGAFFPDGQSSAIAFQEMIVKDDMAAKSTAAAVVAYGFPSLNQTFLIDGHDHSYSMRPSYKSDSAGTHVAESPTFFDGVVGMPVPPSPTSDRGNFSSPKFGAYTPSTNRNGVGKFNGKFGDQEGKNLLIPNNAHELESQNVDSMSSDFLDKQKNDPVCFQTMPAHPEMHAFHLLPRIPLPGIELTASPVLQQYYFHSEYPAYMPPHPSGHTNMARMNSRNEGYCRMYQQLYYQRQLQIQGSRLHQIGGGMNSGVMPLTVSAIHSHEFNGNLYPNSTSVNSEHNQLGYPASSVCTCQFHPQAFGGESEGCTFCIRQELRSASGPVKEFRKDGQLDRNGKGIFPEKMLTRSDGVNSLKTLRSNTMTLNRLTSTANNHEKVISNGHIHHVHVLRNGCFQLDGRNCCSSNTYKSDALKPVLPIYTSVDEVVGKIYYLAKDQHGCRFLQRKFVEGAHEDIEKIFAGIICHIVELMTDQFGNYLVQKLLEVCTKDQRMQVIQAITKDKGELLRVSCDMHGTRAVQKVIETLQTTEQISMIVSSLKPDIVALIKHVNGSHVAQRCLQHLPDEFSGFLHDAVTAHCVELATNRQGCCVIHKCLHHSNDNRKHSLISVITSNALVLSQDQYGNYVVQFVMDQNVPSAIAILLDQLKGNYAYLSMQKHSSNVVEKCLRLAGEDKRAKIIQELLDSSLILQIVHDPYGNYVIQSALNESTGSLHAALVEAIRPHVPSLRSSFYGKKVLSSVFKK